MLPRKSAAPAQKMRVAMKGSKTYVHAEDKYIGEELSDNEKSSDEMSEEEDLRRLIFEQNRKKKKAGGFQAMGLSHAVAKGIQRKGYKVPTPIQRKCIPLVMDGRDVVAMARTGSGKTAAFLIPMFEKLKSRNTTGARALILSPTRELASQTFQFTKELGKFTGLKSALILGGDKMENQFAAVHEHPDVMIASPGRLLHILVEMNAKLSTIEYVVFDEADRLFEMGFAEQLREILNRIPDCRQTLLFSATLPKSLVEFAGARLNDPTLVRLDIDSKISDSLKMAFLICRSDDKISILLHILHNIVKQKQQTVIFAATRHHVEYIRELLLQYNLDSAVSYSNLDPAARKINMTRFRSQKVSILIVTDIAARGLDIPMLDNAINFNFPAKSKLFLHRVGRVARAGRVGSAFSLVSSEELPYLVDLHMFLGHTLSYKTVDGVCSGSGVIEIGAVPPFVIEKEIDALKDLHETNAELSGSLVVCENAYKKYVSSRPQPSAESVKRAKLDLASVQLAFHPIFEEGLTAVDKLGAKFIGSLKSYKPTSTIFETNRTSKSNVVRDVMMKKREQDEHRIAKLPYGTSKHASTDFFVPYKQTNADAEKGLAVKTGSFETDANQASVEMTADDEEVMSKMKKQTAWDRKKKKFVTKNNEGKKRKIRTESGVWIPASYKSNTYAQWQKRHFQRDPENDTTSDSKTPYLDILASRRKRGKFQHSAKSDKSGGKRTELRSRDEIVKNRKQKDRKAAFQQRRAKDRQKRCTRQR